MDSLLPLCHGSCTSHAHIKDKIFLDQAKLTEMKVVNLNQGINQTASSLQAQWESSPNWMAKVTATSRQLCSIWHFLCSMTYIYLHLIVWYCPLKPNKQKKFTLVWSAMFSNQCKKEEFGIHYKIWNHNPQVQPSNKSFYWGSHRVAIGSKTAVTNEILDVKVIFSVWSN